MYIFEQVIGIHLFSQVEFNIATVMFVSFVLISITLGLLYWFLYGSFGYWKKRNVPFPQPTAFVGNIGGSLTFKEHLATIYQSIYNNFKNCSWLGIYNFRNPCILLRDVDLIKDVLIKDFASFHDNDFDMDEEKDPLFGKNPFSLKGKRWKFVRSQVTAAITTGKIKNMFSLIANVNKDLVEYLNKEAIVNEKDGLDAKDLSARFTTDVVAACAFGLEGKSFTDPNAEFKRMGEKLFEPEGLDKLKTMLFFIFPSISNIISFQLISKDIKEWFMGILRETIKYREENNIVRNDYLDMMLSLKNKPGEYEFTELDVMAQSMTFYADGMETSATALSFALFELAKNPDIQQTLREEINEVMSKRKGELSYETVQEMQYLDMVLLESLRMYAPVAFLQKRCTIQYTLPPPKGAGTGPGVIINPGMSVLIPVYAVHYDPELYPDPTKFDPTRFTEEEKQKRPKCAFLPFGEGPRQCLGFRFALMQIKAAIVAIVSNFEIKLNKKTSPIMEIDANKFMLAKKGGIHLDFNKI